MIEILSRNWGWALLHPIRSYRFARGCVQPFPTNPERKS